MKNPQRDILILLTCFFSVCLGAFLLGRNYNHDEILLSPLSGYKAQTALSQASASNKITLQININTASVNDLMTLPGIGQTTAEKIVHYREQNGPFSSVAQLTNISGIGEKKLAEIIDLITVR